MKVYIMLQTQLFGQFAYYGIAKTKKEAESKFRKDFPHMVKSEMRHKNCTDYYSNNPDRNDCVDSILILRIKEEEV